MTARLQDECAGAGLKFVWIPRATTAQNSLLGMFYAKSTLGVAPVVTYYIRTYYPSMYLYAMPYA